MKRIFARNWEKRAVWALGAAILGGVFALDAAGTSVFGDEPAANVGGGPCVVGPDGELICDVDAAESAGIAGTTVATGSAGDAESAPKVDLATQPWLVESVNLPPNHPALKRDRMIWADSYMWTAIEDVVGAIPVEKWATDAPKPEDFVGKYVLVEMWATWCPPCRRSLPYLNFIAKKYKDDLVVVSICETDEEAIRNMPGGRLKLDGDGDDENRPEYFVAIDTGRRLANKLGVYGIPHVILLEPTVGGVVWEGMPTAPRYELDDKTLERFFKIGRKLKDAGRLPEVAPIRFEVSEPTAEERASRRNVKTDAVVDDAPGGPSF